MQIISKIIQQKEEPAIHNVIWIDCSDEENPIAKIYKNNEWIELDSDSDPDSNEDDLDS